MRPRSRRASSRRSPPASLDPGERLPAVRDLAAALAVSPATVAAAFHTLRSRGLVTANRRAGTVVRDAAGPAHPGARRPLRPAPTTSPPAIPTRTCCRRSPRAGRGLETAQALRRSVKLPTGSTSLAGRTLPRGIEGDIAIAGGALDAIERVLQTQLRAGDKVAVEDSELAAHPRPVLAARAAARAGGDRPARVGSRRARSRPAPRRARGHHHSARAESDRSGARCDARAGALCERFCSGTRRRC